MDLGRVYGEICGNIFGKTFVARSTKAEFGEEREESGLARGSNGGRRDRRGGFIRDSGIALYGLHIADEEVRPCVNGSPDHLGDLHAGQCAFKLSRNGN